MNGDIHQNSFYEIKSTSSTTDERVRQLDIGMWRDVWQWWFVDGSAWFKVNNGCFLAAWPGAQWRRGDPRSGVQQRRNTGLHVQHAAAGQRRPFWCESLSSSAHTDARLALICDDSACSLRVSTDLQLYNEALKVLHDFRQYYPFEVAASGWRPTENVTFLIISLQFVSFCLSSIN